MGKLNFAKKTLSHFIRGYEVYNTIEVSRKALLFNSEFFKKQTNHQIIPVLKGNAYGHGIEVVAEAIKGQDFPYVAVDGYFESLKVHEVNKHQQVLVMGMIKPKNISRLHLKNKAFVVHDVSSIKAYGDLHKPIKLHLEINTGMNRYGISKNELAEYLKLIASYPKLMLEGVMSHLADADGADENTVNDALKLFEQCVEQIRDAGFTPTYIHIGQSAGSMRLKSKIINASRIGIGFYGINPFPSDHPLYTRCQKLKPVLTLKSTITETHTLSKGDKVSYNYTFTAPKKMKIGVLPLGYHEGVNRDLSNQEFVKIGSQFCPIVGRVCMNHTMIDITNTDAKVGDEVTVYSADSSDKNSIMSTADDYGLFTYRLLTSLSPDVRRTLVP